MRLFHLGRLSDAGSNFVVHSHCYDCGHKAQKTARELLAVWGDLTLEDLRERAYCRSCKSRHVVLWEMSPDENAVSAEVQR